MRLAYADPPYPGRAHLYEGHPDYAGEVDHAGLIEMLRRDYDGWALSTSSTTLQEVLRLCPPGVRLLAWCKNTVRYAWEPVILHGARPVKGELRDWIQVEPDSYQWRPKPDSYVIGQKPEAFSMWLFSWLGAEPEDEFHDLFPGSGNVQGAWMKWSLQPTLPIGRSPAAEKRAARRAQEKALKDQGGLVGWAFRTKRLDENPMLAERRRDAPVVGEQHRSLRRALPEHASDSAHVRNDVAPARPVAR